MELVQRIQEKISNFIIKILFIKIFDNKLFRVDNNLIICKLKIFNILNKKLQMLIKIK